MNYNYIIVYRMMKCSYQKSCLMLCTTTTSHIHISLTTENKQSIKPLNVSMLTFICISHKSFNDLNIMVISRPSESKLKLFGGIGHHY